MLPPMKLYIAHIHAHNHIRSNQRSHTHQRLTIPPLSTLQVVRKNFRYLLFAHVLRAKDLPQESNMIDRVLQGGSADPDPFAIVEVLSSHGQDIAVTKAAVRVAWLFSRCM